jgi:GT2 family glycosyltransferase
MDICVVTFENDARRIAAAIRPQDRLYVRDNSIDNIGFAAGANVLAAAGQGQLIAFVNPDGDPAPGCFQALEAAFNDPAVVACEPDYGPTCIRDVLNAHNDMDWLMGACLAVRRTDFDAVGGFDKRLFMYCEDLDLSYKLARRGVLRKVPGARYEHDHDGTTRAWRAMHRNFRNQLVVHRRHTKAEPLQMLRDVKAATRGRHWRMAVARLTGLLDYALRAWRWA